MSRALNPHQYPHRLPPPLTPTSPLDFKDSIPFKELQLSNEALGSGSFGTVFKGRWRCRDVAVKQFKTREEIDSFSVELKQLSCVKHINIVTLYGASTLSDTAYLIMEYAEGGSLNHLLHECREQHYDLSHACSWAMQTARGVAYLHGIRPKPIMHRDLKPANLLLFARGKTLKICDFGTACTVKTQMTNNTGSASYMAPEVFSTDSYLESGDVFSWSIIFWELLARQHPYSKQYSNPYQILWGVNAGTRPDELEDCPPIIWKLITRSWDKSPNERPSMQQIAKEMELICGLIKSSTPSRSAISSPQRSSNKNSTKQSHDTKEQFVGKSFPSLSSKILDDADATHPQQLLLQHQQQHQQTSSRFSQHTSIRQVSRHQTSTNATGSNSSTRKIELYHRKGQLNWLREQLAKRAEQLLTFKEPGSPCDKSDDSGAIVEFEILKRETELRIELLKARCNPSNLDDQKT